MSGRPKSQEYPQHSDSTRAHFLAVELSRETLIPEEAKPESYLQFPICGPPGLNGLLPRDPHLLVCIIGALLQRLGRPQRKGTKGDKGSGEEARRLATMIRILAVRKAQFSLRPSYFETTAMSMEQWMEAYGDLLHAIAFCKVPRHTHMNEILPLQREVLKYFFHVHKYPTREINKRRNPATKAAEIKTWIREHEHAMLNELYVFPCLCQYSESLDGLTDKLLRTYSTESHVRDLILATLHKATVADIVKWSKPKSFSLFPDLLDSRPLMEAISWPDE